MPISVCRQQNGETQFNLVTKNGHPNHKTQLKSLHSSILNNPYHLLDEENSKPLHKLVLPNGNVVYSTHKSTSDLVKALHNNNTNLAQKHNLNFQNLGNAHSKNIFSSTINKQEITHKTNISHNNSPKKCEVLNDITNSSTNTYHNNFNKAVKFVKKTHKLLSKQNNFHSLLIEAQPTKAIMTVASQTPSKSSPSKSNRKTAAKTKIVTPNKTDKTVPDNSKISDPYDLKDFLDTLNMKPKTLIEAQKTYVQCYRAVYGTTPRKSSYEAYNIEKICILLRAHVSDNQILMDEIEYQMKQVEASALLPQKLVIKADFPLDAKLFHDQVFLQDVEHTRESLT